MHDTKCILPDELHKHILTVVDERLVIFSGKDEDGNTLAINEQFDLFSSAETVIGPRGMDSRCNSLHRPKVIEFVSSERSKVSTATSGNILKLSSIFSFINLNGVLWKELFQQVQNGSFWGYWYLFGSLQWIDYHQVYYTLDSTDDNVLIDQEVFIDTLYSIWNIK